MKTPIKHNIFILIIFIPVLFLSACEGADLDLLEIAFESWAEENNLYENGEYKPANMVIKAAEDLVGDITNAEVNTQFDAVGVVRDINKADELAAEALMQDDLQKMEEAIELRPKDWRLQEQNAVLLGTINSKDHVHEHFYESDDLLTEQIKQGGDCVGLRTQQLEYREILLTDAITHCSIKPSCDKTYLVIELELVQERLYHIYGGNAISFCY